MDSAGIAPAALPVLSGLLHCSVANEVSSCSFRLHLARQPSVTGCEGYALLLSYEPGKVGLPGFEPG